MSLWCFLTTFGSIQLSVWEEMSFEEFQDGCHGGHLGYRNGTILAILSFGSIWHGFGGDIVWRISRWPPSRPYRKTERNNFSNSGSLCHCDVSHQVLAQSNLRFGRRCRLKNFKMAAMDIETEQSQHFWISMSLRCSHKVSAQSDMVLEEISFEEFQDGRRGSHLGYQNGTILAILNLWQLSRWCLPSSFHSIWLTDWEEMSFEQFQEGPAIWDIGMERF